MNLRSLPKYQYSGLTVIMSNPSRFDNADLLSGMGGHIFFSECLADYFIRGQIEIRLHTEPEPLLPGTKCCLVMGHKAMHSMCDVSKEMTLGEQRGSPLYIKNTTIPAICTYNPQDCIDVMDYEARLNPALQNLLEQKDEPENDADAVSEKRRHGKTARRNWRFWLKKDTIKACRIITEFDGHIPRHPVETEYIIYPRAEEVIQLLTNEKQKTLYIDLETDSNRNITCIGLSFSLNRIYVLPVLLPDYNPAYDCLALLFRGIGIAMRDNETVAYNGAAFDFFILAEKYSLGIGRKVYDPMLAFHRCWPTVEKSLGHATSLLTFEPYHKDEGNFSYGTRQQAEDLWKYCGKDIRTMIMIRKELDKYAKQRPGLTESIQQANNSIRPYLICSLFGMRIDEPKRLEILAENDRYMMQFLKWVDILVGKDYMSKLRKKSKNPLPNSNNQCVEYFHNALGYGVIQRSQKTGKPSLAKQNLYKLRLKENNPVLTIILAYRGRLEIAKKLIFEKWKNDRVTCTWKISGANTFRLASTMIFRIWGTNCQNFDKELRKIVIPD